VKKPSEIWFLGRDTELVERFHLESKRLTWNETSGTGTILTKLFGPCCSAFPVTLASRALRKSVG